MNSNQDLVPLVNMLSRRYIEHGHGNMLLNRGAACVIFGDGSPYQNEHNRPQGEGLRDQNAKAHATRTGSQRPTASGSP